MDLEGIVLSDISQRKTNTVWALVGKDETHSCHKPHPSTVPAVTAVWHSAPYNQRETSSPSFSLSSEAPNLMPHSYGWHPRDGPQITSLRKPAGSALMSLTGIQQTERRLLTDAWALVSLFPRGSVQRQQLQTPVSQIVPGSGFNTRFHLQLLSSLC